jgi:hypothetical protein
MDEQCAPHPDGYTDDQGSDSHQDGCGNERQDTEFRGFICRVPVLPEEHVGKRDFGKQRDGLIDKREDDAHEKDQRRKCENGKEPFIEALLNGYEGVHN